MQGRRILVCGGRGFRDEGALNRVLDWVHRERGILAVIHGACHLGGADVLAGAWARSRGVVEEPYPVDHEIDGPWPAAGPRRNFRMLVQSKPNGVIAFPGGNGTETMMSLARSAGVPVWEPLRKR